MSCPDSRGEEFRAKLLPFRTSRADDFCGTSSFPRTPGPFKGKAVAGCCIPALLSELTLGHSQTSPAQLLAKY